MFGVEINDTIVLEQKQVLEQALSTNPKTQAALRKLIQKVIKEARATVVKAADDAIENDPRGAARAVRTSVYKKILGANINIYNSRKAHGSTSYEPPRHPSHRGGNRRTRSGRTAQIMGYDALDRGFILRWINDGMTKTRPRTINFEHNGNRKVDKWNKHPNTGNRGAITARNFFRGAGERALVQATNALANLIDEELMSILNKK